MESDFFRYIIVAAAAGGCLMLSTLVCLVVRCIRKGDTIEADP